MGDLCDNRGQLSHTWGDAAYPVKNIYDDYGQLHQMITYRGNLAWGNDTWPVTTNDSDRTTWHYDPATGLLTAKEDADGNVVSYTYTYGGKLKTRTWARTDDSGQPLVTTYIYDPATAELTNIDYSDTTPDVAFTYDRLGRQQIITDAVGTRTFTYNATMQPESETITGLQETTITRTYETSGVTGRSSGFFLGSDQQASDYRVSYGYDSSTGRFQSVSWNVLGNSETTVYSYLNDSNLIETLATGNAQLVSYAYEAQRNLKTSIRNTFNNNPISKYDYSYDAAGRRQSVMNSGQAFTTTGFNLFNYNTRNELTASNRYQGENVLNTSTPTPAENRTYNYDAIGNRTTATAWDAAQQVATALTYTANRLNQYDLIASAIQPEKSLSFDKDGNLTGIKTGAKEVRYSYDAENRLVAVAPAMPDDGGIKVEFLYDYMGRRVQKKVFTLSAEEWAPESDTFFTYDGWNLIRENKTVSNGQAKEKFYVWGLDLSQSLQDAGGIGGLLSMVDVAHESSYLYFYDGNGNVGQFVDSFTGGIGGDYEYDPYGNVLDSWAVLAEDNPFRLSTKYHDDKTGLVYYGNRYYIPELGRWLNRDPIGERGGSYPYTFLKNSPTNYTDFLGMWGQNYPGQLDPYSFIKFPFSESEIKEIVKDAITPTTWLQDDQKCKKWISEEIDKLSWLKDLPDCPCELYTCTNPPSLPMYANKEDWGRCHEAPPSHIGGVWEIRSVSFNGHGQQCIYAKDGQLMTKFAAAGTPDKSVFPDAPTFNEILKHAKNDLLPWMRCGGDEHAYFIYNTVRPPNKGAGKGGKPCQGK